MNITLVDKMGDDTTVVNAARVSFNKEVELMDTRDEKLIAYLAKHNHWTPFAHPQISFRVRIPVFLARQYFKHIVGSVKNEVSRRYVSDEPEFYQPYWWKEKPDGSIKQGSGENIDGPKRINLEILYEDLMRDCLQTYKDFLAEGVAPEQARMVLPQSMYTEFIDTGSLVYWARMYKQRSDKHAQSEWWPLMDQLDSVMSRQFPVCWGELTNESK